MPLVKGFLLEFCNGSRAQKTRMTYQTIRKVWQYVHSFKHKICVGQTDKWTDGGICHKKLCSACTACWHVINMGMTLMTCSNVLAPICFRFMAGATYISFHLRGKTFYATIWTSWRKCRQHNSSILRR